MRKKANRACVLLMALGLGLIGASSGKTKTAAAGTSTVLQDKDCGFSLRYPKEAKLEVQEGCVLKITLPPIPGQDWIREANITLEVSGAKDGEATERPVDEEETIGYLVAGGLKFEKSLIVNTEAGLTHTMVSYTAIGKKHQYHWLGIMTSADPAASGRPLQHWDPARSAQKIFDGFIQGFRPLE